LYVGDRRDNTPYNRVVRFDGTTGAYIEDFVAPGASSLNSPHGLEFDTQGILYAVSAMGQEEVVRFGRSSMAVFTVSLSRPSGVPVTVQFSTVDGSGSSGSDYRGVSGTLVFEAGVTTRTILVSTVDDAASEFNEAFSVLLSNPLGAGITDSAGTATILDNDSTKFFVVNDATQDLTYEYASSGAPVESNRLNSGNTAPRGAASTATGDRVWVVDANKKVYVYDASGTLLGSWAAGSLPQNAQIQGIATDGTNIWVVDAAQDKVFRYTGAAGRLSGSQNAASSFGLNKNNKSPKDIVTDGTHLWVVEDGTTDKVFKYTTTGSLVGSWTITAGGGSPTGITLDPSNPNHLWIVDAASDRVYQYDGAVTRTSGSQSSSTSFPLAAGNSNPQGIADPRLAVRQAGDANLDGVFSSNDLVQVLQAGKYEDDVASNATWHEGDWNGDGDFTSQDFVLAFQRGSYSAAARADSRPRDFSADVATESLFADWNAFDWLDRSNDEKSHEEVRECLARDRSA
jgi:hypothetical protein